MHHDVVRVDLNLEDNLARAKAHQLLVDGCGQSQDHGRLANSAGGGILFHPDNKLDFISQDAPSLSRGCTVLLSIPCFFVQLLTESPVLIG
jgi:hypothetical protein